MKTYQAKDIQKILGIPKNRYDYILLRLGVKADIEDAQGLGTGKTSLYSFKALIEFAIASAAIDLGIKPKLILFALDEIKRKDSEEKWGLFDEKKDIGLTFHFATKKRNFFYCFSGDVRKALKKPCVVGLIDKETGTHFNPFQNGIENASVKEVKKAIDVVSEVTLGGLENALSIITLNLGEIKKDVLGKG